VTGEDPIVVTGSGSAEAPYVVAFSGAIGGDTAVTVADTATIDMTITGTGALGDPYVISGVVIAGTVTPSTEATQDIIGAALGDGLEYDDAGNTIAAFLSTDADNTVVFGTDGGLYSAAADVATFMTLGTDQTVTGSKTWDLPDDLTTAIRIDTVAGTDPVTSEHVFRVFWDVIETFWLDEVGALRVFTPDPATLGYDKTAAIFYSRQDIDTVQIYRAGTANLGYRLRDIGLDLVQQYGGFGSWEALTAYSNGFLPNAGGVEYEPRARRSVGGDKIDLRGRIDTDGTPAAGQAIATLPAGHWPLRTVHLDVTARSPQTLVRLDISTAGVVTTQTGGTYTYISLDGVDFYVGAN
jgi:hypothetical protein